MVRPWLEVDQMEVGEMVEQPGMGLGWLVGLSLWGWGCDMSQGDGRPRGPVRSGWLEQEEEVRLKMPDWPGVEHNLNKLLPIVQLICN